MFQNLSVIRFSFTIRYLLTKDNNKEIIGCADLATNIFNSATSESAIIFRENKHTFIKKILDTLIPSNGGYLVIWYPLFDKKQYLYPIITRIPSAPPYSLCLSRWYPMLPDKSKSFFPNHVPSLHLSQKEEYVCLWQHWPMNGAPHT